MSRAVPRSGRGTRGVLGRYLLVQAPGWALLALLLAALHQWLGVPLWIGLAALALWLVKDLAFYPLVREAYRPNHECASRRMIGARGTATERLEPTGYVRVGAELWRARMAPGEGAVELGDTVVVREVEGLTLVVAPAGSL
jgi:membrane protein implicated in regulation of membrane protease activity